MGTDRAASVPYLREVSGDVDEIVWVVTPESDDGNVFEKRRNAGGGRRTSV